MGHLTRREVLLGLVSVPLLALCVLWFPGRQPLARPVLGGGGIMGETVSEVLIRGNVDAPIRPGSVVSLDLELRNPNDVDLTVSDLTVTLHRVSAPNADREHPCGPQDYTVRQVPRDARVVLPGKHTSDLEAMGLPVRSRPAVGMLDRPVNQDGCRAALLTLRYAAHGVEVRR